MRWSLRLLAGLLVLVLSLTVVVAGTLFVLDEEDYRSGLVWAADEFLDATLRITGTLALRLGRDASLTVDDLSLRANDGSYSLTVGEFETRLRLDSLLEGIFWVKHLVLSDVHLEAKQAGDAGGFDFHGVSFPTFVIEEARLHNLYFVYREANTDKSHTLALLALVLDDVNNSGPLGIEGEGLFENRPIDIKGRMDSLAQLTRTAQPYGVYLDITSGTLESRLEGTIARPLEGSGLDLELSLTDPDISKTLRLWNDRAPAVGAVSARMRLRGDYGTPRLEEISASLTRPGELDLNVSGEIGDLLALRRMALRFEAQSSNPSVTSWLLFDNRNTLQSLAVQGTVRASDGDYRVEDLQAKASTRSGVRVELSGSADIQPTLRRPPVHATQLQLALDSPTTKALTALVAPGGDTLPELGRVSLTSRLVPYLDGVSLDGVSLAIGGPGQIRATASGSIDAIPYARLAEPSGLNLAVDVQGEKSAYLTEYFNPQLPELGAVQAQARVRGRVPQVSIESLKLTIGPPRQPLVRADGSLRTEFRQRSSTLDIGFDVAIAKLVAVWLHEAPADSPGRLQGSMTLSDTDGSWGVEKFTMVSAETPLFRFSAAGTLDDLPNRDQGQIRTLLEIDDVPALGRALGVGLSGFSPYRGQGHVKISKGGLDYDAVNTLGATTFTTHLTGSLTGDKPKLKGKLEVPVLHLADFGLGRQTQGEKGSGALTAAAGQNAVFSRRPFDLSPLRALDLDLGVAVAGVAGAGLLRFERLDGRISLQDGVLRVSPVRLEFEGGPSTVDLEVDARQKPAFSLRAIGDDLALGPALAQIQNEVPVEGDVNLQIDVSGAGDSPHELASSLDGKFNFGLENARVPRKYVEFLAVDVFGWVVNTAMRRDPYANLDCVMGAFDIKDGIATSSVLVADGPALGVTGTATLDLEEETMDITLLPKQKKTLFSTLAPVHIKGPWRDPKVTALPVKSALTSLGSLVLTPALPMVAISALLGEKLWATLNDRDEREGGCVKLARKIEKEKAGKN